LSGYSRIGVGEGVGIGVYLGVGVDWDSDVGVGVATGVKFNSGLFVPDRYNHRFNPTYKTKKMTRSIINCGRFIQPKREAAGGVITGEAADSSDTCF